MNDPRTARRQALEQARRERRRIADTEVHHAIERMERGGITALATSWVRTERGRPRTLSAEGLLAGMFLTAAEDGRILLTAVTDTLYYRISPRMRERLGIVPQPDTDRGFEAAYAVVRRLFHRIAAACDPSPLPKNHRMDRAEAARFEAAADTAQLAACRARLVRLTGLILEDSLQPARDLLREHWDGSGAVDGTVIRAYAKGVRSAGPVTASDPDAAWHVRTGDHAEPDPTDTGKNGKKKRRGEMTFGYEATIAIARNPAHDGAPTPHGHPDPFTIPALVLGFLLDKPGHQPGPNAITVLADIRRRSHPASWMAGDKLYNNSEPDQFQLPLRALGYKPVFDYRGDQLGIQAGYHGAIQVEGSWYCPATPRPLIDATADLHAEQIDKDSWAARITARAPYRLYPKQAPDQEGHRRLCCPASAGKVHCPLKPATLPTGAVQRRVPLADPEPSPVGPPVICRQDSITIPPEAGAKHAQDLPYGSSDWARTYHRLRNSVESINGFSKDANHEAIEAAGTRRIRGIAAQSILLAFQLHHANTRKITTWLDTLPGQDGAPPRRRTTRRRRTKPPGHLDTGRTPRPDPAGRLTAPDIYSQREPAGSRPGTEKTSPRKRNSAAIAFAISAESFTSLGPPTSVGAPWCARGELNPHALAGTGT